MYIDLNSRKEMLTNQKETLYVISEMILSCFGDRSVLENLDMTNFLQNLVDIDEQGLHNNDFQVISSNVAIGTALLNTKAIFDFAESPIEKIFLNALNIVSFPYADACIIFTPSGEIRDTCFIDTLETQKYILDAWYKLRNFPEGNDVKNFIEIINIAGLSAYKDRIIAYIVTEYLSKLYSVYFITLQPTIREPLINGKSIRPDIYIWNPYHPDFKLIVECDGYKYHADKLSFSLDRTRDRQLHMRGFKVLRFSGSDIVNNPNGMAEELYLYLVSQKPEIEHSF